MPLRQRQPSTSRCDKKSIILSRFFEGYGTNRAYAALGSQAPNSILIHAPPQSATRTNPTNHSSEEPEDLKSIYEYVNSDPGLGLYLYLTTVLHRSLVNLKPVLIQESLADNPWKLLLATIFLNKTAGKAAIPLFQELLRRYPTPTDLANAHVDEIEELIRPLGLQNQRAKRVIDFSAKYIEQPPSLTYLRPSRGTVLYVVGNTLFYFTHPTMALSYIDSYDDEVEMNEVPYPPTPISHLPGVGPYALDSYRIFCFPKSNEWKSVMPNDKELIRYMRWRWAYEERKQWVPGVGVVADIDVPYLLRVCEELAKN